MHGVCMCMLGSCTLYVGVHGVCMYGMMNACVCSPLPFLKYISVVQTHLYIPIAHSCVHGVCSCMQRSCTLCVGAWSMFLYSSIGHTPWS